MHGQVFSARVAKMMLRYFLLFFFLAEQSELQAHYPSESDDQMIT